MPSPRVILGVVGDDIHVVGNRIIHLALQESGFEVHNLQVRNQPEHFAQAALEVNAHAVFLSSLNGEGEFWCTDFRRQFVDLGISSILLYVGGNLVVGKRRPEEVVALFKQYGFDRVYHQKPDISEAIDDLWKDLSNGSTER